LRPTLLPLVLWYGDEGTNPEVGTKS